MLLDSEIARIKAELGYNVLTVGAEPYIGVTQIFEQVIQPYVIGGTATTSSTAVAESDEPTPRTLVLAGVAGFTVGDAVAIDVDIRQERATIQSLSGASIVVLLSKVHSGTYPVTVEGPETIVREILQNIIGVRAQMSGSNKTVNSTGGLKQVDEVQWYDVSNSQTTMQNLQDSLDYWREQLAAVLGIPSMWSVGKCAASTLSVY